MKTTKIIYALAVLVALIVSAIASGITCYIYFKKTAYHHLDVISKFCTNLMSDFIITADDVRRR